MLPFLNGTRSITIWSNLDHQHRPSSSNATGFMLSVCGPTGSRWHFWSSEQYIPIAILNSRSWPPRLGPWASRLSLLSQLKPGFRLRRPSIFFWDPSFIIISTIIWWSDMLKLTPASLENVRFEDTWYDLTILRIVSMYVCILVVSWVWLVDYLAWHEPHRSGRETNYMWSNKDTLERTVWNGGLGL